MSDLVPLAQRLQSALLSVGHYYNFSFPQIAVVGAQSVGKSSVLEYVVAREFLPRGQGIVTRRPLVVHTRRPKTEELNQGLNSWFVFDHNPDVKLIEDSEVRAEIVRITNECCGSGLDISPKPIVLTYISEDSTELTLVDLPGLTKVAVADQPSNIGVKIRTMVNDYISTENVIILAVSAANVDLANSDALDIAREVDPKFERTIGVLTKMDLADPEADIAKILSGKAYPLKLGWVGVKCRTMSEDNAGVTMAQAQENEEKFFRSNPMFVSVNAQTGVAALRGLVASVLHKSIVDGIPRIREKMRSTRASLRAELENLGTEVPSDTKEREEFMKNITVDACHEFAKKLDDSLEGRELPNMNELHGGALLQKIFTDFTGIMNELDNRYDLSAEYISTAMQNASGSRCTLFVPQTVFELLVKQLILELEEPCLQCTEYVYRELHQLMASISISAFTRFPLLEKRLHQVANSRLESTLKPTVDFIKKLIAMQHGYINFKHPDVITWEEAIIAIRNTIDHQNEVSKEKANLKNQPTIPQDITSLTDHDREITALVHVLKSYMRVVRTSLADAIPKALMTFIVYEIQKDMSKALILNLFSAAASNLFGDEDKETHMRRSDIRQMLEKLDSALKLLEDVVI